MNALYFVPWLWPANTMTYSNFATDVLHPRGRGFSRGCSGTHTYTQIHVETRTHIYIYRCLHLLNIHACFFQFLYLVNFLSIELFMFFYIFLNTHTVIQNHGDTTIITCHTYLQLQKSLCLLLETMEENPRKSSYENAVWTYNKGTPRCTGKGFRRR